jgi:hypothetical protein
VSSRWYRERITVAIDEFGAGDQRAAVDTLLDVLEGPELSKGYACADCGQRFEWPGLLERHKIAECLAWERAT